MEHLYLPEETLFVVAQLQSGSKPSAIANALHKKGLSPIQLMQVFRQATGAGIYELKSLGQWWGAEGVTDTDAFDAYAVKVFSAGLPRL